MGIETSASQPSTHLQTCQDTNVYLVLIQSPCHQAETAQRIAQLYIRLARMSIMLIKVGLFVRCPCTEQVEYR